jgi:hypothetical protein
LLVCHRLSVKICSYSAIISRIIRRRLQQKRKQKTNDFQKHFGGLACGKSIWPITESSSYEGSDQTDSIYDISDFHHRNNFIAKRDE